MTKEFNLLDEPWLLVRMCNGEVKELGLLALFEQINEISSLAETAPPSLIAQYRLLLAIVNRALSDNMPKWKMKDRESWFTNGLPSGVISTYLEKWRDRFWLFHPECPFMQVAALATAAETENKVKPWTQIDLASAGGNAAVVFDHSLDEFPSAITPANAVRKLLGFLQFTPGGLVKVFRDSDKAGPLANTAAALPCGETLNQTLSLSLHPISGNNQDLPRWERPPLSIADLKAKPVLASGPNDRYTRQTRAVLLLKEVDGAIRWLRFGAGQGLEEDPHSPDFMASFRSGSMGPVRLTFTEGRAFWRDLAALLPNDGVGVSTPAAILENALSLNEYLNRSSLLLLVAGLASDQAKLLRWRVEQLRLPQTILMQPDASKVVRDLLKISESLFMTLREAAVQLIADTLPDSQQKDTRKRARDLFDVGPIPGVFFSQAERSLMKVLEQIGVNQDKAYWEWEVALDGAAQAAWKTLLASRGESVSLWRANARAEPRFLKAKKTILTTLYEKEQINE